MVVKNIELPIEQITEFCERWKIQEFALFGSVLRNDFNSNSDIDVLVNFSSDHFWTLFDYVDMQDELSSYTKLISWLRQGKGKGGKGKGKIKCVINFV
jgi:hypothetical protein